MWWRHGDVTLPISMLVPAYNEAATIAESVRSLLGLQYPSFEIVVINDGSKDDTLATMIAEFALEPVARAYHPEVPHQPIRALYGSSIYPRLLVVDKENGGKSDALNAGINVSRSPLFCAVDADSLLESDALFRAAEPFIEEPNKVVAVGGTIRVVNGCKVRAGRVLDTALPSRLLALFQTIEYLRAYLMARLAWSEIGALTLVSGAFGLFRRDIAVAVGGYTHGTVGEDLEIIIKIHRHMRERGQEYAVRFIPEPVCWTEAPETLKVLGRQRIRWQRGALETFFRHRKMAFNPRYGRVGLLGMSNMLLIDVLGPPLELLGYLLIPAFWAMGALSFDYVLALLAVTFVFGVFISVGSLILEELELRRITRARDLAVLTAAAVMENFGYRQLNNFWRILGFWRWIRGAEGWGAMSRAGFRKA
jgi:cellulose synthase/poly-beta-1,6-N-acetylglucosamine synthase-like glycosyltransferase